MGLVIRTRARSCRSGSSRELLILDKSPGQGSRPKPLPRQPRFQPPEKENAGMGRRFLKADPVTS
jgi:hypothetical protein